MKSKRPVNIIPIKITAKVKRDINIDSVRVLKLTAFTIGYIILLVIHKRLHYAMYDQLLRSVHSIMFFFYTIMHLRLAMKYGLDEKELYKKYLKSQEDKTVDLKDYWDVLDINKALIKYVNKDEAVIVKFERSNTLGRKDDFIIQHYESLKLLIREFLNAGYIIRKYSLAVTDTGVEKFDWLIKRQSKINNPQLVTLIKKLISHAKGNKINRENRYLEYWLIVKEKGEKHFQLNIQRILNTLGESIYKPEIIKEEEQIKFLLEFFRVDYINLKENNTKVIINESDSLIKVVDSTVKRNLNELFKPIETSTDNAVTNFKEMLERREETK